MKCRIVRYRWLWGALGMVILILDAPLVLKAGSDGLSLCLRSVIPALFPLMVLSIYTTGNLPSTSFRALRPLCRLCRISEGAEGIFLTGLLGGYPTGAQAVTLAWQNGILEEAEARRMLGFCNNAGPAFLFGILAPSFSLSELWVIWLIQIISAIVTAILLPGEGSGSIPHTERNGITLSGAVSRAVRVMVSVCGWIILFRVLMDFMEVWMFWFLPESGRILLRGLLELTNGCMGLIELENVAHRFLLAAFFLSFGGCCVGMQTHSVTGRLGTGMYLPGKLLQGGITLLLGCLMVPVLYPGNVCIPVAVLSFLWILTEILCLKFWENNSSNFMTLGV